MWHLLTNRRVLQAAALMGVLLVVALWPEATVVATLRQISEAPEAPGA